MIDVVDHVANEGIVGIAGILNGAANGLALAFEFSLAEFVRPVHQFGEVFLRILVEILHYLLNAELFHSCRNIHMRLSSFVFFGESGMEMRFLPDS